MIKLVNSKNGELITTTKKIADVFGKTHRDVIRALNQIECSDDFRVRNFAQSSYVSPQNKVIGCFNVTRDGFAFLCMGFTGKKAAEWKEKYIKAFNEMELNLSNSKSVMTEINEAILIMEQDKELASQCARGLCAWRKLKKNHEQSVQLLIEKSQLVLGLDFHASDKQ